MTDETVEPQGGSKRSRENPEAPHAAMGFVDVCTILCGNSERATAKPVAVAEGREGGNSERTTVKPSAVAEGREGGNSERTTVKPSAVAEERESGPLIFDLRPVAEPDAEKKENSKPVMLMESPIDSDGEDEEQTWAVPHLTFVRKLYELQVRE